MSKLCFSNCNNHLKSESDYLVKIKCSDNLFVESRESYLWEVDFIRMAIQKVKNNENFDKNMVELNFMLYPKYVVQLFVDILTGSFDGPVGPNESLKLITFIYDCDHYDETEFPWHFHTINILIKNLEETLCNLCEAEKAKILFATRSGLLKSEPI